jgi:hypothetical protein
VAAVPAPPRSILAGVAARDAEAPGDVVVVAPVLDVVEDPTEVAGAVVDGTVAAIEVAGPATIGPPWPSVGLDTAGDRSHPSPTPTPTDNSIATTRATTAPRRRRRDPASPFGGLPFRGLWTAERRSSADRLLSPSGGPGTGGSG